MKCKIRKIEVPLETGKVIEYEAQPLCKLIEGVPDKNKKFGPDVKAVTDKGIPFDFTSCRPALNLVVLERWGSERSKEKTHKIVILREDEEFELTLNYEWILSRRGKFTFNGEDYYLFQL
jgi:hypothetical protein